MGRKSEAHAKNVACLAIQKVFEKSDVSRKEKFRRVPRMLKRERKWRRKKHPTFFSTTRISMKKSARKKLKKAGILESYASKIGTSARRLMAGAVALKTPLLKMNVKVFFGLINFARQKSDISYEKPGV